MVFIRPTILRTAEDARAMTARRYDYVRGHADHRQSRTASRRSTSWSATISARCRRSRPTGRAPATRWSTPAAGRAPPPRTGEPPMEAPAFRARRNEDRRGEPSGGSRRRRAAAPSRIPYGFARRHGAAADRRGRRAARRRDARGRRPEGADRVAALPRPAASRSHEVDGAGLRPPALRPLCRRAPRRRRTRRARSASTTISAISPRPCRAPRICSTRPTTRRRSA